MILLIASSSFAQENKDFPSSNALWSEVFQPPYIISMVPEPIIYALFEDDTLIKGKLYSKLYSLSDTIDIKLNSEYIGGIRSDTAKRVYYFPTSSEKELLLYDFDVEVGDTIYSEQLFTVDGYVVVSQIDSIDVNGQMRALIHFEPYPTYPTSSTPWIEGIGGMRGLLFISGDVPTNGIWGELACFKQNGITIYQSPLFDNCFPLPLGIANNDTKIEKSVDIYPNPADRYITIKLNFQYPIIYALTIYDMHGIIVFQSCDDGEDELLVNTSCLIEGLYSIVIKCADNLRFVKMLSIIR